MADPTVIQCDSACTVTVKHEVSLMSWVQPLTASEAGQLTTSIVVVLVLAFVLGRVVSFVWSSR